jgi:predicted ATP-grasp superfamily ATP-dependent carboligase
LWQLVHGEPVRKAHGAAGVKWRRLSWDLVTLANDLVRGRLAVREYVGSRGGPQVAAIFARDDPLPGFAEVPLLVFILFSRLVRGDGV